MALQTMLLNAGLLSAPGHPFLPRLPLSSTFIS